MTAVWTEGEFYRQRDRRSFAVLGRDLEGQRPVHIDADDTACRSAAGQVLLLALANQLARVHRAITFSFATPGARVVVPSLFEGNDIRATVLNSTRQIDPFGVFAEASHPEPGAISLGIGPMSRFGLEWYVGAEGAVGILAHEPAALNADIAGTARGAAIASCLGAAAVFRSVHGLETVPRRLSAWNYAEGNAAEIGPRDFTHVEIGRTLMVGAGAVASALTYWWYVFGFSSEWMIADGDFVRLHNTNRSLVFTPAHAGWGGTRVRQKVDVLARYLPKAEPEFAWYHKSELAERSVDVILALANEYDVRALIASRSAPVVLHATTGENWISQLHRHVAGRDDCIGCRTLGVKTPSLTCSTGTLPTTEAEANGDAALPFLSAASGLMLATALERLSVGVLDEGLENDWRWDWSSTYLMARDGIRRCRAECKWVQPQATRRVMHAGTRWIGLDR